MTHAIKSRFDSARSNRYLNHLSSVSGWLSKFSAETIVALSEFQNERDFQGAVAEIGVHHGKLFVLAYLTTKQHEPALAIDVFDQQHLNIDKSGCGNKTIFLRHLRKWAGDTDGVELIEDSSLNVETVDILDKVGRIRFFSIDGGHTEEATTHDLRLAESVMTEEGIIALDDCFSEFWPEVSSAVSRYLMSNPTFVPFAMTPGKVYLCRDHLRETYQATLRQRFPRRIDKIARLYGHDGVHIVGVLPWTLKRAAGKTRLGEQIKGTRLGRTLKQILP